MPKKEEIKNIEFKNQEVTEYDFVICPNCGAEEVGKFCPRCGQSNKDFNKPIKEIIGDLLDSINLDIRLLNTLIPFFTKPGFLAQEYFRGKRKRYVPPMRMYMFISIIFFFLVQYFDFGNGNKEIIKISNDKENISINLDGDFLSDTTDKNEKVDTSIINKYIDKNNKVDKEKIKQEILEDSTMNPFKESIIGGINASEKKELFLKRFLKNISYVLFILMPFFACILAMVLWRSKMLYVKHLIFSINFHSFIFGLSSLIIILFKILPESTSNFVAYLWLGIPIYLMMGIARFYNRNMINAFFKMLGTLTLYTFIILIVVVAVLAFTAKGFYTV